MYGTSLCVPGVFNDAPANDAPGAPNDAPGVFNEAPGVFNEAPGSSTRLLGS